jgi:hypothetical protein
LKISDQVQAVHVDAEECCDEVQQMWYQNVAAPLRESGKTVPELILLSSPYRYVIMPLVEYIEYILKVERDHPDRQIAVLVPELADRRPRPRTGRQTLVADPSAQSTCSTTQASSCSRQSAHHRHQHSLVFIDRIVPPD